MKRALAFSLVFASATYAATPDDLQKGLTAYLPFDGDIAPRHATGSRLTQSGNVTFGDGKAGQAVIIADAAKGVEIPGAGNFSRPRGTLAFWVQPAWTVDPTSKENLSLFGTENFVLNIQPSKRVFFFMTGSSKPVEGYKWDYGAADYGKVPNWKPGEWHHMAVTWDSESGEKAIYIDGALVKQTKTEWIRKDEFRDAKFVTLGGGKAPGAYDELLLWNRVLSADEVKLLFAQPQEVARELATKLPQPQSERRWPIEFSLYHIPHSADPNAPQTIIKPGEKFTAKIPVYNSGTQAWQGKIGFALLDFWEKSRDQKEVELSLKAGEKQTLDVAFAAPERGIFKIAVKLNHNGASLERDVASFAAWPEPIKQNPDSFWGHHVNTWSEGTVAQAARLGLSWNRAHNMLQHTWWPRVQPENADKWNWNWSEHRTRMQKHNMSVLGQLFGTPYWAAAGGPLAKPDTASAYPSGAKPNLEAFRKYVYETVKNLPEIRHWEVWNEPEVSMFWNGSPEEFGELCKVAYEAAKAADPTVTVMNGGYTGSAFRWHEKAAEAGAVKHADAISVHLYHKATATPEDLEKQVRTQVEHWNELTQKYAGRKLPIWDTESGSGDTTFLRGYEDPKLPAEHLRTPLNWRQAAISAVQIDAIKQSLGIVRSFAYLWQSSGPGAYESLGAIDMTNAPKPKIIALTNFAEQINGAKFVGVVKRDEGRLWAGVYQKADGGSVVLMWAGRGGKVRVPLAWLMLSAPSQVINLMGNVKPDVVSVEVSEEPVFAHIPLYAQGILKTMATLELEVLQQPEPLPQAAPPAEAPSQIGNLPDFVAPRENPAGVYFIDLRGVANMAFADDKAGDGQGGWADEGSLNSLHSMPLGRQTFYGVPFDVIDPKANNGKAIITLKGKNVTPNHPAQVTVLVNQIARNLYFLHAAAWGVPGDIGQYIVRYAAGQSVEIPLKIPGNTNNWWSGYVEGEEARPVPVRVTETLDGKPAWRYVRVYEWQNPRQNVPIQSIEAVSNGGVQSPILIAVTGVK